MKIPFTKEGLLVSFLLAFTLSSFAQVPNPEAPKIIPPTPNAAALAKVGDVPVSLYTGQANVSIPIYTIQFPDFSYPITLSYGSNGLRVEEYASWVGMGWTMNATGVISRQVRGLEDEAYGATYNGYNGYLGRGRDAMRYINNQMDDTQKRVYLKEIAERRVDAEPDIFVYNTGTHSGKLFFDDTQCLTSPVATATRVPVLLPHKNLYVTAEFDYLHIYNIRYGSIRKFYMKDDQGVEYFFETLEAPAGTLEQGDPDRDDFVNSWYLTKIITPNGRPINFVYEYRNVDMPETVSESRYFQIDVDRDCNYENSYKRNFNRSSTVEAILKEINYPGGKVTFTEGDIRADWNVPFRMATLKPKTLAEVKVFDSKMDEIKTVKFTYDNNSSRLRLDKVQEFKGGVALQPAHEFFYQGGTIPAISTNNLYSQDYWGFYNASGATTLLPNYNTMSYDGLTFVPINFSGADRSSNPAAAEAGMLERIKYPTGGTTAFTYEGNDYYEPNPSNAPGYNPCGNLTSLGHKRVGGAVMSDYFEFTNVKTCVDLKYTLQTKCPGAEAWVSVNTIQGAQMYFKMVKQLLDNGNQYLSETVRLTLAPGTYRVTVWADQEHCNQNMAAATAYGFVDSGPMNIFAGGVRLKTMEDCAGEGVPCSLKRYLYTDETDPTKSSGKVVSFPIYVHGRKVRLNCIPDSEGSESSAKNALLRYEVLSANSNVPVATTLGGYIGYRTVTVLEGLNGENGKTVHTFNGPDQFPDLGNVAYPFPPLSSMDWQRGKPVQTTTYRKSSGGFQPLTKAISAYSSEWGDPMVHYYNRVIAVKSGTLIENLTNTQQDILTDYIFSNYAIYSGQQFITSEEKREFAYTDETAAGEMIATTTYAYTNLTHLLPTSITTTDSYGNTRRTDMKYPHDDALILNKTTEDIAGINALKTERKHATLVEKQTYENNVLKTTERTVFSSSTDSYSNTRALPASEKFALRSNSLATKLTYFGYDDRGNLKGYSAESTEGRAAGTVLNTIYLWSYNLTLPVAEVKNANLNQASYTSFEETTSNTSTTAKTGKKGYTASYTVTLPTPPGSYRLSYWRKPSAGSWTYVEVPLTATTSIGGGGDTIDEVRVFPVGALMTTFIYEPNVGMTSSTDPNNVTTNYEYENGKLKLIRDDKGNIVKTFIYNYKQ